MRVALIVPSCSQFMYVKRTIKSALANTPNSLILLVDDHSKDWVAKDWLPAKWGDRLKVHRFQTAGGLTRSWNKGLEMAFQEKATHVVCANSDLWFPQGWWIETQAALERTPDLCVGPVTNAPGPRKQQLITRYLEDFQANDEPAYLDEVSRFLQAKYQGQSQPGTLNGFCMTALAESWKKFSHSPGHVFNPGAKYKMVLNEDELLHRWKKGGGCFYTALGSFVWHYRGVSRGGKAIKGASGAGWYRRKDA